MARLRPRLQLQLYFRVLLPPPPPHVLIKSAVSTDTSLDAAVSQVPAPLASALCDVSIHHLHRFQPDVSRCSDEYAQSKMAALEALL